MPEAFNTSVHVMIQVDECRFKDTELSRLPQNGCVVYKYDRLYIVQTTDPQFQLTQPERQRLVLYHASLKLQNEVLTMLKKVSCPQKFSSEVSLHWDASKSPVYCW